MTSIARWFKNGDHPDDGDQRFPEGHQFAGQKYEGKVVRYFRHPYISGETICETCQQPMHVHGWIDRPDGGATVCPGDFIVTISGIHHAVSLDAFR